MPAQEYVVPLLKTTNMLEDQINPFHQPNIIYDKLNCYGGGDYDGNGIGQGDIDAAQVGIKDDRIEVNGDNQVNNQNANLLQNYKDGNSSKLPFWWNFSDKNEKISWLDKMLAIDQTDTITPNPPNWVSKNYAIQTFLNFQGFEKLDISNSDIPEKYSRDNLGRFNIPVYYTGLNTPSFAHGMNAVLVGDNPLNFYDWQFIEPQSNHFDDLLEFGVNWFPPETSTITITKPYEFNDPEGNYFNVRFLVEFKIDSTGTPVLYGEPNPNLLLTRPTVGIEDEKRIIPKGYSLEQNFPNPFNSSTTIQFDIPQVETGHALSLQLIIYNINGEEIATLIDNINTSGTYSIEWNASGYPSGIYLYQLVANSQIIATKKMLLLR